MNLKASLCVSVIVTFHDEMCDSVYMCVYFSLRLSGGISEPDLFKVNYVFPSTGEKQIVSVSLENRFHRRASGTADVMVCELLEESFQRNSFPSYNEVEHLMITTKLSREELESWFSERRGLRDYLEQALLNSMGSRRDSQQPVLNGSQRSGTHTFSPVPSNSKSVNRVKNGLVQSRWSSPVEFRCMEMQTLLARTELVRWFRDSQLAQQSCILDRKEVFVERNGCRAEDYPSPKDRPLRQEIIKPSSPEIENRFSNTLTQHTGNIGEAFGNGSEDFGVSDSS